MTTFTQISIPKKSDIIEEINKPRLESENLQQATENIDKLRKRKCEKISQAFEPQSKKFRNL